jgi:hypothetical protein
MSSTGEYIYVNTTNDFYIYDSNYKVYQIGYGWVGWKLMTSNNAFTLGPSIWDKPTHNFEVIQNISNAFYAVISKNGLVLATSSFYQYVCIWRRERAGDQFTLRQNLTTLEIPTIITLSSDGSYLGVPASKKLYFYKNVTGIFQLYDSFIPGLHYGLLTYPQILGFDNFNLVMARDNSTIKFYSFSGSAYQQYKNMTFKPAITDWSLDNDHLVIQQGQLVRVFRRYGADFSEVQNMTTSANTICTGNGTLITTSGNTFMVWKSMATEEKTSEWESKG